MARADMSMSANGKGAPQAAAASRIVMATGAYPPDVCGVGDYTYRLMEAAPKSWQLLVERDWSLAAAPKILRRLLERHPTELLIQYPTEGYGWSLVPHLLVVAGGLTRCYRSTLVLHEFSSLSQKARLALALASHFAARVIFTTEAERDRALASRWFARRVPTSVIGILSNIPFLDEPKAFHARRIDLAYFGHIRPNKGLETFLDVIEAARQARPELSIAVIGEVPAGYEAFGDMVAARCGDIGCEQMLGLDDEAAAHALADVRILYLPFRDGISARRGTALAGFGNGALIASRVGTATPKAMLPAIIPCSGSHLDADILIDALAWSDADALALQAAGRGYIAATLPKNWVDVTRMYIDALSGSEPGPRC